MDIRLYKYESIKGKEETSEEWLNFLNITPKGGRGLIKRWSRLSDGVF